MLREVVGGGRAESKARLAGHCGDGGLHFLCLGAPARTYLSASVDDNVAPFEKGVAAQVADKHGCGPPTEAINGVIETTRRIARGFRNFTNYRLRCLLAAGGHRPYRIKQTNHA